jgi:hypothetical protein
MTQLVKHKATPPTALFDRAVTISYGSFCRDRGTARSDKVVGGTAHVFLPIVSYVFFRFTTYLIWFCLILLYANLILLYASNSEPPLVKREYSEVSIFCFVFVSDFSFFLSDLISHGCRCVRRLQIQNRRKAAATATSILCRVRFYCKTQLGFKFQQACYDCTIRLLLKF